jgi:hypothetical protein
MHVIVLDWLLTRFGAHGRKVVNQCHDVARKVPRGAVDSLDSDYVEDQVEGGGDNRLGSPTLLGIVEEESLDGVDQSGVRDLGGPECDALRRGRQSSPQDRREGRQRLVSIETVEFVDGANEQVSVDLRALAHPLHAVDAVVPEEGLVVEGLSTRGPEAEAEEV